jgi:site-specific recombinase XerD
VSNYRHNLSRFANFLDGKEVTDISTADIREFLSHVRSTPFTKPNGEIAKVKEATVHAYWKAVRSSTI